MTTVLEFFVRSVGNTIVAHINPIYDDGDSDIRDHSDNDDATGQQLLWRYWPLRWGLQYWQSLARAEIIQQLPMHKQIYENFADALKNGFMRQPIYEIVDFFKRYPCPEARIRDIWMDRIVEWTTVEIDRIWSCANTNRLPLPPLEEEEEQGGDEDDSRRSHARSELLTSDDMDFGH